jgi:hypothetical protein
MQHRWSATLDWTPAAGGSFSQNARLPQRANLTGTMELWFQVGTSGVAVVRRALNVEARAIRRPWNAATAASRRFWNENIENSALPAVVHVAQSQSNAGNAG